MNTRVLLFTVSITIVITALCLLLSGSSVLLLNLASESNIPLGTFVTWAGITSFPLAVLSGNGNIYRAKLGIIRLLNNVLTVCVFLGAAWGIVGFLLAGNWGFNFSERESFIGSSSAYVYFWSYTAAVVGVSLFAFIALIIRSLIYFKFYSKSV